MRLLLAVPTEPRSSTSLDKDSLLKNCFIDKDPSALYIVKRPGQTRLSVGPTGTSRGVFFLNGVTYYIDTSHASFPVRTV